MKQSLFTRLKRLEGRFAPPEDLPKLFIAIVDSSVPDPEQPESPPPDFSDEAILGVTFGRARGGEHKITRLPGESWPALQDRAGRLAPDAVLFHAVYRDFEPSLEKFINAAEFGSGDSNG